MKATVGDRIIIASSILDRPARSGVIVEVRSDDGSPPYLVEWSDAPGHEGLIFPGPDAHVEHVGPPDAQRAPAERTRTWRVHVEIVERDGQTSAHATLVGQEPTPAAGGSRRNSGLLGVPELGDELAAAQALHRLADRLLATATAADVGEMEGAAAGLQP